MLYILPLLIATAYGAPACETVELYGQYVPTGACVYAGSLGYAVYECEGDQITQKLYATDDTSCSGSTTSTVTGICGLLNMDTAGVCVANCGSGKQCSYAQAEFYGTSTCSGDGVPVFFIADFCQDGTKVTCSGTTANVAFYEEDACTTLNTTYTVKEGVCTDVRGQYVKGSCVAGAVHLQVFTAVVLVFIAFIYS